MVFTTIYVGLLRSFWKVVLVSFLYKQRLAGWIVKSFKVTQS